MMQGRLGVPLMSPENPLWISWHDTNWLPILNPTNVMDYFCDKANPFYDRTCNNEIVKMQRQSLDQLNNMIGVEYILLHVQATILYVVRKQHRHSPTEATPLADYYIIAGTVYQAPDLASVFNSKLLAAVHHLQSAFEEASSYSRYQPNKGYSWDFSSNKALTEKTKALTKKDNEKTKEEPSSLFQRRRVDMLLEQLLRKFPLPMPTVHQQIQQQPASQSNNSQHVNNTATNVDDSIKTEITIKQDPDTISNNPSNNILMTGTDLANTTNSDNFLQDNKIDIRNHEMKPPPEKRIKL